MGNLIFKEVKLKNFLSFGNVEQTVNLNNTNFQLIVGQNKDKSDDDRDRNGCGKTAIFEAIHFALFGKSIGNKTTLPGLVNNINKKNMVVSIIFEKDGIEYAIIRGRSPSVLRFYKNNEETIFDESQGDSRRTQEEIEKILGLDDTLFSQLIALTCKVPLFLSQTTSNQKEIIEKVLGIDLISKKVSLLKEKIKDTKNELNNAMFQYNTLIQNNTKIEESIATQIQSLELAKKKYFSDKKEKENLLISQISELSKIDVEFEEKQFELLKQHLTAEGVISQKQQELTYLNSHLSLTENTKKDLENEIYRLKLIDFNGEKLKLLNNSTIMSRKSEYEKKLSIHNLNVVNYNKLINERNSIDMTIHQIQKEIDSIKPNVCPTCNQSLDTDKINEIIGQKNDELTSLKEKSFRADIESMELKLEIDSFKEDTFNLEPTIYSSNEQIDDDYKKLLEKESQLLSIMATVTKIKNDISNIEIPILGDKPSTYYDSYEGLLNHKITLQSLTDQLISLKEMGESATFNGQENSINEMKKLIVDVDDKDIRKLENILNHQEILLKLLNSPSSFIRQQVIEKSLGYLNSKILHYLVKLGSLHIVKFNNDMSIDIGSMGQEFSYVSTGEEGRISIALMFAFRDVWENLNNCSINLLALDELVDRLGLDTSGVEQLMSELKGKSNDKNVLLVTHNDTLINQTQNILKIIKENRFTNIQICK